jgi:hypothetical protein
MLNSKMLNWKREVCVMIKLHVDLALQQQQQQKRQSTNMCICCCNTARTKLEPDKQNDLQNTKRRIFMDLIIQSKNNHVGNSLLLLQNCWQKF